MAEEGNRLVAVTGYALAILFSPFGLLYGIILFFMKNDEPYYAKHAKYIIITAVAVIIIGIVLASMMGMEMM